MTTLVDSLVLMFCSFIHSLHPLLNFLVWFFLFMLNLSGMKGRQIGQSFSLHLFCQRLLSILLFTMFTFTFTVVNLRNWSSPQLNTLIAFLPVTTSQFLDILHQSNLLLLSSMFWSFLMQTSGRST